MQVAPSKALPFFRISSFVNLLGSAISTTEKVQSPLPATFSDLVWTSSGMPAKVNITWLM